MIKSVWCCDLVANTMEVKATMDILHRRERHKANKERAREKAKEYVANYLATHPCSDCQQSNAILLTFDHVRGNKRGNISDMVLDGLGLETIKAEILLCEVVCFNCHALRTQKRERSYRWRMGRIGRNS